MNRGCRQGCSTDGMKSIFNRQSLLDGSYSCTQQMCETSSFFDYQDDPYPWLSS